jgi:hypothetical protein
MNKLSNESCAVIFGFLSKSDVQSIAQCSQEMKSIVKQIEPEQRTRIGAPLQIIHHRFYTEIMDSCGYTWYRENPRPYRFHEPPALITPSFKWFSHKTQNLYE